VRIIGKIELSEVQKKFLKLGKNFRVMNRKWKECEMWRIYCRMKIRMRKDGRR
jgi:hypothetical protein